jgi:hypothetical protein
MSGFKKTGFTKKDLDRENNVVYLSEYKRKKETKAIFGEHIFDDELPWVAMNESIDNLELDDQYELFFGDVDPDTGMFTMHVGWKPGESDWWPDENFKIPGNNNKSGYQDVVKAIWENEQKVKNAEIDELILKTLNSKSERNVGGDDNDK